MQIESVALNKIIPYIRNPRKNENAVEKVASSIQEFGFRQPIVVDTENVIIAGHTRFEAAKRLGLDLVPVHIADGLTEQQVKAYRIADNRVGQEAEWDYDLLKLELEELDNPEMTGFDEDELNGILAEVGEGLTDPDEVPEVPVEPVTVSGDLWELGEHRLLCGDATKAEDVERLMGGEKADMVFTDIPYGIDYSGGRSQTVAKKSYGKIEGDKNKDISRFVKLVSDYGFKRDSYICVSPVNLKPVFEVVEEYDACIVWKKNSPGLGYQWVRRYCEFIVFASNRKKAKHDNSEFDYWDISTDLKTEYKHGTQKPVALPTRAIEFSSVKNDLVVDYFLGSGSTLIACQKTGRKCYGMEIDPQYCDVIITRWSDFTGKDDLLLNGKPFKWSERKIKKAA